ncbi:MAG: TM2 domain-containing protein [Clostridia bacterium]|nr:TM2 domain-containing protein [Clostridia bacterium]
MRCPVCGARMISGQICRYCNVTSDQVLEASNKEAKKAFKEKRKEEVCFTTNIPKDVNKLKLVLYTILLGWVGVGSFYVGRIYKGLYSAITFGLMVISVVAKLSFGETEVLMFISSFITWFMVANLLMWISDIFGFIFRTYKVPVVLPKNELNVKHHSIKIK